MYFADSMKVDLDIAGNCEMESMRSAAVLVGRANKPRRAREEKETAGRNSRLGRAIVRSSKPSYYAGYVWRSLDCLRKQTFLLAHRRWGDVSHGGTSVTQRQKSHADDVKSVRNRFTSADY